MKISHLVHTGNGTHSLFLDRELREFTGIQPGTRVRITQVDKDQFAITALPYNKIALTDPIMGDNFRIGVSSTPEMEAIFGQRSGELTLDVANKGYVVFSTSGPLVFNERGQEFLNKRAHVLKEARSLSSL